ncbi:hypothetical protein AAY473_030744 [Plecturocebus cupreus]
MLAPVGLKLLTSAMSHDFPGGDKRPMDGFIDSYQYKNLKVKEVAMTGRFLAEEPHGIASMTLLAGAAVLPVPQHGVSQGGVYGTDGLGWSHPDKENSNWKR